MNWKWGLPGVLILLAIVLVANRNMINELLYPAPPIPVGHPPEGFSEVAIDWKPGQTCVAWYHRGDSEAAGPVIVYFHGNGENLETLKMGGLLRTLSGFGSPVLAVDYPGYGRSTGKATEPNITQAADAAVRWILKQEPPREWIAAGWSLGAAVAIQAASRNPASLKALVAMSGWTSLKDAASAHYPAWIAHFLLTESYDSVAKAPGIQCPVLVIHGEEDDIIPATLGSTLASAFPQATWTPIAGAGHNDLLSDPRVWEHVSAFFKKN
jgi:pimeloyl-ACP methyl ester carboxylesterase